MRSYRRLGMTSTPRPSRGNAGTQAKRNNWRHGTHEIADNANQQRATVAATRGRQRDSQRVISGYKVCRVLKHYSSSNPSGILAVCTGLGGQNWKYF